MVSASTCRLSILPCSDTCRALVVTMWDKYGERFIAGTTNDTATNICKDVSCRLPEQSRCKKLTASPECVSRAVAGDRDQIELKIACRWIQDQLQLHRTKAYRSSHGTFSRSCKSWVCDLIVRWERKASVIVNFSLRPRGHWFVEA
jgi:hypothetical protein